jgi:hypothetical protein
MSAVEEIKALIDRPDPFAVPPGDLRATQLAAVQERFAEMRPRLRVLDQRARDAGVDEIRTLDDLVPLLFSHTNYKSYPEAFIDGGQWRNMTVWLQTMTARPVEGVDLAGVRDADDWIDRLRAAGHHVYASSGTSGKCSFLDQTGADAAAAAKSLAAGFLKSWAPTRPNRDRVVFSTFPPSGVHRWAEANATFMRDVVAAPGEHHKLSEEPLRASPGITAGRLRRAMAAGRALPEELGAFGAENAARAKAMQAAMEVFVDKIHDKRDRPLVVSGMWGQAYQIMLALKARGVKDGDFHPDTLISVGGGTKGVSLPDDYQAQIKRFFGVPDGHYANLYGMVEVTGACPFVHGRQGYVVPPWSIPLVLDKAGERLLNPECGVGEVTGRMAFFDLMVEARWGGVISGDKATVDFSATEGAAGPLIRDVARYQDLEEGEDKLTCAGAIDAYVRGEIAV